MMLTNPFAAFKITQGWKAGHEAKDYGTPFGTEFTSPADGVYRFMGGSTGYNRTPGNPGLWARIFLDDGSDIAVCHLSRHIAANGARVEAGLSVLAATGNSGYVIPAPSRNDPRSGSHMHTYGRRKGGARWDWTLDVGTPAGGETPRPTPDPTDPKEWDEMATKEEIAALIAQNNVVTAQSAAVLRWIDISVPGVAGLHPHVFNAERLIAVQVTDPGDQDRFTRLFAPRGTSPALIPADFARLQKEYGAKLFPPTVDVDGLAAALGAKLGVDPEAIRATVMEAVEAAVPAITAAARAGINGATIHPAGS